MNRDEALIALGQGKAVACEQLDCVFWKLVDSRQVAFASNGMSHLTIPPWNSLPVDAPDGWYVIDESRKIPASIVTDLIKAGTSNAPPVDLSRLEARLTYLEGKHGIRWHPDQVIPWPPKKTIWS